MKALSVEEVLSVSGGMSDSEANQIIGDALGTAWHGISSTEGIIGMALGPGGMIAGAIIHFKLRH